MNKIKEVVSENLSVEVTPDENYEFLMTNSELQVLHGDGMVRQPAFSGLEPCRMQFTQSVLKECAPACFLFRLYHRHDIRDFS